MMRYCTVPGVPGPAVAVAVAAAVAKKLVILIKNDKIIKNIKIVNLEILKVKTWFGDKDL